MIKNIDKKDEHKKFVFFEKSYKKKISQRGFYKTPNFKNWKKKRT
jgi:hypothetical protein